MKIIRNGIKFYAPDEATSLGSDGNWILNNSLLINYDEYEKQLRTEKLQLELNDLLTQRSDIKLADINIKNDELINAVEKYNENVFNNLAEIDQRIDEINRLLT